MVLIHTYCIDNACRARPLAATVVLHGANGLPLEPWDFHLGATLRVLGRQLTLKKVPGGKVLLVASRTGAYKQRSFGCCLMLRVARLFAGIKCEL